MKFLNFLKSFITYLGFFLVFAALLAKDYLDLFFINPDGTMNAVGGVLETLSGKDNYFFPFMFIPIIMIGGHLIFGLLTNARGFSPKVNLIIGLITSISLVVIQIILRVTFKSGAFFATIKTYPNFTFLRTFGVFRTINVIQFVLIFILGFCFYSFFVGGATYEYIEITTYYNESGVEIDSKTSSTKYAIWLHLLLGVGASVIPILLMTSPLIVLCVVPFVLFLLKHKNKKALIIKAIVFTLVCGLSITPVVLTSTNVIHIDTIHYLFDDSDNTFDVCEVDYDKNIKSLVVPDKYWGYEVGSIVKGTLKEFRSLETLSIPTTNHINVGHLFGDSDITECGFQVPETLKTIKITNQEYISDSTFTFINNVENIILSEKTKYIADYAFYSPMIKFNQDNNCNYLGTENNPYYAAIRVTEYSKIFKYHKDTVAIAQNYVHADKLEMVIIPESVKYFFGDSFYNKEESITDVPNLKGYFYEGNFESAEKMEIILNGYNEPVSLNYFAGELYGVKIYYYSETKPTENGNYWRYGEDGITPIIW